MALARTAYPRGAKVILGIGLCGAALFFGDAIITPAVSVLSAVEGLEVVSPAFKEWVIPLTLVVLFCLFAVQKRGTTGIGRFFGPITLVWFATISVMGVSHILKHPEILYALSPHYALQFMWRQPGTTFIILGAVVLCVTGAEALYADMGHFGKRPIRIAWTAFVLPALALNYAGQGALLLRDPAAVENPFYLSFPPGLLLPAVAIATAATIIASQAVISGAYSLTQQAIQLGFLPRMQIVHTSAQERGQIYMPGVNWLLLVAVVLACLGFGNSSAMASAYGIAVTGTMLITTVLTYFVVRHAWGYPAWIAIGATAFFVALDLLLFVSCSVKVVEGGWFPLALAAAMLVVMTSWKRGREQLAETLRADQLPLPEFVQGLAADTRLERIDRTAVFLSAQQGVVPLALCAPHGLEIDDFATSYFLSRETVVPRRHGVMARWRQNLFEALSRNAGRAVEYFAIPHNAVIELGTRVQL
jgi:KUP system potassium uptake protein